MEIFQPPIHRLYLKELISEFNDLVKSARAAYFSNLISSSKHNPRVLFKTINSIVSPPSLLYLCFQMKTVTVFFRSL